MAYSTLILKEHELKEARKKYLSNCIKCQSPFRAQLFDRETNICEGCKENYPKQEKIQKKVHHQWEDNITCSNCQATNTPLWRRDEAGNTICNACGLYYKLHHVHRPRTMMNSVIKRRKRCPSKKINFTEKSIHISSSPSNSTSSSSCTDEELESESTVKKVMISTLTLPPVYNSNLKSLNSQRSELQKQVNRLSKLLSNTISRLSEVDEAILRLQKQSNEDQLVANSLLSLSNSYPITLIGQSIKHA
ncbi:hypothetical protein G6F57_015118 [Rhizopus arrhizus]|nr:hypothetical protein G6F22_012899 [Rhizopus arrhizus]KAG0804500.1 hypothetical protein G6F20_012646 [Rhizopus arrhizus]KAG0817365.1 hypothetical protein G6F19_012800 [Rhizopus arrhizus]KAG0818528.1 hypothetical protein G6F18_012828 [Rhizopus arrhizus]KAG0847223.1 hypothetical protein G6F17_012723 [Rhizopus arrhizus]